VTNENKIFLQALFSIIIIAVKLPNIFFLFGLLKYRTSGLCKECHSHFTLNTGHVPSSEVRMCIFVPTVKHSYNCEGSGKLYIRIPKIEDGNN
jgi:hypothetical protein